MSPAMQVVVTIAGLYVFFGATFELAWNGVKPGWVWRALAAPALGFWRLSERVGEAFTIGVQAPPKPRRSRAEMEQRIRELEDELGVSS